MTKSPPPLSGIRVLDLTQFLSGPWATQILADLGADVVKVEAPDGDLTRHLPPNFVGEDSVYFMSANRSKRSVALDLKQPEGQAVLRDLALACDVVVENFRPGVVERLGLDPAWLRKTKPEAIWASISGFGQDGPYRDKPAYDMIVQALSGGMSLTGEPGRPAVRAGIPIGDLCAGMYAAIGILAALRRREVTGDGETVDVSMLDCQVAMTCYQSAYYMASGTIPGRQGRGHDSIPTYRSFSCRDGVEIVVTANTERMWASLCDAIGRSALAKDPRFATNRDRHAARDVLASILEDAFAEQDADAWVPILERAAIPVGIVNAMDRVVADPQIAARGIVKELEHADGRRVRVMGDPIRMEGTNVVRPAFPPALGEHSRAVLESLAGIDGASFAGLVQRGVVRTSPAATSYSGSTA